MDRRAPGATDSAAHAHAGFTIIELMVVVAVIGILASIAAAQYAKFSAKARQAEVKIHLAGLYTAERGFAAENDSYTMCMRQAGFVPENGIRYYTIAFVFEEATVVGSTAPRCGPKEDKVCVLYGFGAVPRICRFPLAPPGFGAPISTLDTAYVANAAASMTAVYPPLDSSYSFVSKGRFIAVALGSIRTSSTVVDVWTINETKELENRIPGL